MNYFRANRNLIRRILAILTCLALWTAVPALASEPGSASSEESLRFSVSASEIVPSDEYSSTTSEKSIPSSSDSESSADAARNLLESSLIDVRESLYEPPEFIDRWNDPDAYPDFSFDSDAELLEIWFPRIRDRDAAIFLYQGQCWMIDCSDDQAEKRLVPVLQALGIKKIDRLFNTHPHHDHLNGIYYVDEVSPVKELMICFPEDINSHMINAMEYAWNRGIIVTSFGDDQVFPMGDGMVRFLCWMKSGEDESINDRSAQIMVSYGDRNMLFMADIENRGQKQLLEAVDPEALKADILRYPHHGKQAMIRELYDAIDPKLVVVTSTYNSSVAKESTQFLSYLHVPRAYTTMAYLHLVTDGKTWLCEKISDEELFPKEKGIKAPVISH